MAKNSVDKQVDLTLVTSIKAFFSSLNGSISLFTFVGSKMNLLTSSKHEEVGRDNRSETGVKALAHRLPKSGVVGE